MTYLKQKHYVRWNYTTNIYTINNIFHSEAILFFGFFFLLWVKCFARLYVKLQSVMNAKQHLLSLIFGKLLFVIMQKKLLALVQKITCFITTTNWRLCNFTFEKKREKASHHSGVSSLVSPDSISTRVNISDKPQNQ